MSLDELSAFCWPLATEDVSRAVIEHGLKLGFDVVDRGWCQFTIPKHAETPTCYLQFFVYSDSPIDGTSTFKGRWTTQLFAKVECGIDDDLAAIRLKFKEAETALIVWLDAAYKCEEQAQL